MESEQRPSTLSSTRALNEEVQTLIAEQIETFRNPGMLNLSDFRRRGGQLRILCEELDRRKAAGVQGDMVRKENYPD